MPVYKDEKTNTWYTQFYYKDWDGKRKHTSKRGFTRKRDAQEYEDTFKYTKKTKKLTFGQLITLYLENLNQRVQLQTIRESTLVAHEDSIKMYVRPFFDYNMMLEDITDDTINDWLVYLTKAKTRFGKPLKPGTIKGARTDLSTIFNFAVRKHYLINNPIHDAEKLPTPPRRKQVVWDFEQYTMFYDSLKHEDHRLMFNLLFFCGLRIGELLALTPDDILPNNAIMIRHSFGKVRCKNLMGKTKTPSSVRTISVPEFLYKQLTSYVQRLYKPNKDNRIFLLSKGTIRTILRYHLTKLGLPRLTPHGLRHSSASILLKLTGDIALVSKRLGHKNPQITLQIYSHMLPGTDEEAANKLNKLNIDYQNKNVITIPATASVER